MIKPTHYFVHSQNGNVAKNKLTADFGQYLMSLNGTLVEAQDLQELKNKIIAKASLLNEKHSRCKSLELYWWESDKGEQSLSGFYTAYCYIRAGHIEKL